MGNGPAPDPEAMDDHRATLAAIVAATEADFDAEWRAARNDGERAAVEARELSRCAWPTEAQLLGRGVTREALEAAEAAGLVARWEFPTGRRWREGPPAGLIAPAPGLPRWTLTPWAAEALHLFVAEADRPRGPIPRWLGLDPDPATSVLDQPQPQPRAFKAGREVPLGRADLVAIEPRRDAEPEFLTAEVEHRDPETLRTSTRREPWRLLRAKVRPLKGRRRRGRPEPEPDGTGLLGGLGAAREGV